MDTNNLAGRVQKISVAQIYAIASIPNAIEILKRQQLLLKSKWTEDYDKSKAMCDRRHSHGQKQISAAIKN